MQESKNKKILYQDETLKKKFIQKWFWMYLFTFFWAPLLYLIRVVVSNDLPVADIGIIYSIVSIISIIAIFSDLWLNATMNYYLPKHYINKDHNKFKTLFFLSLIIKWITTIIIWILAFVFLENIANNYLGSAESVWVLQVFLIYFLTLNVFHLFQWFFHAVQDIFVQHFNDFLRKFLIAVWVIGVLFFDIGNMTMYSFAWLFGISGALVISVWFFFKKYFDTVKEWKIELKEGDIKKYILFGIWATLWSNALVLLDQIDQQMVLMFLWTEMAWYYANFISLVILMTFLFAPILGFIFPVVSEIVTKKQFHKLELLQNFFYKYVLVFSLSIWILLSVLGDVVAVVFFWEKYLFSWELLTYVAIFWFFKVMFLLNFSILMGLWKSKNRTLILLWVLFLNIVLNLIMIPLFWALWAWLTTVISWGIIAFSSFYMVHKNCKISFDYQFILKNLLTFVVLASLVYWYKEKIFILDDNFRLQNLLYLFVWGCGYFLIIWMMNYKEIMRVRRGFSEIRE